MGNEVNCCRRPQTQGKKELKTYHQKKLPNYKSTNDDENNNFGTYNPGKNRSEQNTNGAMNPSYFDSIYANKTDYSSTNNFPNFSNFEIEPVTDPIYSNQAGLTKIQNNYSQPHYDNNQYINSYTIPQQEVSQQQYIDVLPTTKYGQSTQEYQTQENNYIQNLPTKYKPVEYITSGQVQYNNSSTNQYVNSQQANYIDTTEYIDAKPISYTQNNPTQYIQNQNIQHEIKYMESNDKQYFESKPHTYNISYNNNIHSYSNYSEQPIEYSDHSKYEVLHNKPIYIGDQNYNGYIEEPNIKFIETQNNIAYMKGTKQQKYNENTQYLENNVEYIKSPPIKYEKSHTSTTQYKSSPPKIEQIQYIEPQKQVEYTITNNKNIESKPNQNLQIESQKPIFSDSQQTQKIQKKYLSKPKEYIEKEKNRKNENENEKVNYKVINNQRQLNDFSQSEDDFPEIQKGPDDLDLSEAEPHPHKYIENKRDIHRENERDIRRENERDIHRENERDIQRQNERDIRRGRERERENEREMRKEREREIGREREREREKERERERERERGKREKEREWKEEIDEGKNINRKYSKNKRRQIEYYDSEEDREESNLYDEIQKEEINKNRRKEERDFSPDGYKRFYAVDDPFFKRPKGKKTYRIYNDEDNESEKAIYEGEMFNGKKHGIGKYTTTKFIREGTWNDDKFTGWGRESRSNGEILEGRFVNGKLEGKGILRDSRGSAYIGDFVDSKKEGFGELDTEKAHYKGGFKNNKFHGHGRMKIKEDESEIEGVFRNGEIEKENVNILYGGKKQTFGVVEKKKEATGCQGPGFINNFLSKMFN